MNQAVAPLDISIFQGDGFAAQLFIKDKNKRPVPLPPGTAITMVVKRDYDPMTSTNDPLLVLKDASQPGGSDSQIKIRNANEGDVLLYITGDQTAAIAPETYKYIIRVLLPDSPGPRVVTYGDFTIEPCMST
jgi:hypothetical protein